MTLSEADIERYARQIVIPQVGIEGQERLLAARVLVVGNGTAAQAARQYLEASGVTTLAGTATPDGCNCAIVAGAEAWAGSERSGGLPRIWCYLDAGRLVAGYAAASQALPGLPASAADSPKGPAAEARLYAAGCEAAARTLAVLLDWEGAQTNQEVGLG